MKPIIKSEQVKELFIQLTQQLKGIHDHDARYQNFDIKPANIIYSNTNGQINARIIDAGLTISNKNRTNYSLYGTPAYQTKAMQNLTHFDDQKFDLASIVIFITCLIKPDLRPSNEVPFSPFNRLIYRLPAPYQAPIKELISTHQLGKLLGY